MSPDDLDDIDGYFDRLPFDPRDTNYRQDIQSLYGQVGDDVVGVMEQLVEQREDATESAIESMFRETYNQGIIDGALAAVEEAGDDIDNHFPNGVYGDGGFMSPTYNFGQMENQPKGGFMSPHYNFGAPGPFSGRAGDQTGTDIPESWDDYEWGANWEQIREPEMESPGDLFDEGPQETGEAQDRAPTATGAASPIIYNPQVVSGGGFFSGGFSAEPEDPFEGMDMPWGDQAS
jgi:hypothetical protein